MTLANDAAVATANAASEVAKLLALKGPHRISVCVPARDEVAAIAEVVDMVVALEVQGLVDEVVIVDDSSIDGTGAAAAITPELGVLGASADMFPLEDDTAHRLPSKEVPLP